MNGDEVYLTEIELAVLQVFIKHRIMTNQGIRFHLEELIEKLLKNQEN